MAVSKYCRIFAGENQKQDDMTAIELQTEYQNLVSTIAKKDYETIAKAVKALKKVLSPKSNKITKADLVIDPRIAAIGKGIKTPESYDYKEMYYQDYMKG